MLTPPERGEPGRRPVVLVAAAALSFAGVVVQALVRYPGSPPDSGLGRLGGVLAGLAVDLLASGLVALG